MLEQQAILARSIDENSVCETGTRFRGAILGNVGTTVIDHLHGESFAGQANVDMRARRELVAAHIVVQRPRSKLDGLGGSGWVELGRTGQYRVPGHLALPRRLGRHRSLPGS
jgi:hypothetical protein